MHDYPKHYCGIFGIHGHPNAGELTYYGLYALQQRSHIRIFILYDLAPRWLRKFFDILSVLCVCIFAFAVIWGGFGEALAKFLRWETFGTAFDPPIPATNKPLILITMALVALASVSNLIFDWNRAPESHEPELLRGSCIPKDDSRTGKADPDNKKRACNRVDQEVTDPR